MPPLVLLVLSETGCEATRTPAAAQAPHAASAKTPLSARPAGAVPAKGNPPQTDKRARMPGPAETTKHEEGEVAIPVVALAQTPPPVHATILAEAKGRSVEKINHVRLLEGPVYRVYIASDPGPQLLTINDRGELIDNAVVVRFEDMPEAVREATKTAAAGKLQVCRKSIHRPQLTYVIDYLLGDEEPAFALIEANGFVRGLYGYAEDDPD